MSFITFKFFTQGLEIALIVVKKVKICSKIEVKTITIKMMLTTLHIVHQQRH